MNLANYTLKELNELTEQINARKRELKQEKAVDYCRKLNALLESIENDNIDIIFSNPTYSAWVKLKAEFSDETTIRLQEKDYL